MQKKPQNLRSYRSQAELKQEDLVALTDLSQVTISNIESGKQTNPSYWTVRKIAEALSERVGVDRDTIINDIYESWARKRAAEGEEE